MESSGADIAQTAHDEELIKRIAGILAGFTTESDVEITASTGLFDDLGLDSTNILEMLVEIEAEMGLEFDTEELEHGHFETVASLAGFISALQER
ncbi:acyl carrier protein [Nocardiopsis tropica]|uniref:acyl carrier protein n=1 Tax=Nocardiopsis tropica TaxID=109330 RepID=UPI002E84E731|nr:acyl carrier protein [Nocardiopsis tropica]